MDGDDIIFSKRYSVVATTRKQREAILNDREIKVEYVNVLGSRKKVFRMYERHNASFGGVGWIVNDDIDECMICGKEFYFFRRKHHCRSCGNLVCDDCSPHYVCVEELKELGDVRVCVQCYWGQYPVYAARERVDSDSDDDSDASLDEAMITGQINAAINASTKAVNVEVEDFLEYCGLVVLEAGSNWEGICSAIWTGLSMPAHMNGVFQNFIIVDEDGDEVTQDITDDKTFWQHSDVLTVTNNNKLLACVDPILKERLYQHRKNLLLEMKSPDKPKEEQMIKKSVFPFVEERNDDKTVVESEVEKSNVGDKSKVDSTPQKNVEGVKTRRQKRRSSISIEDEELLNLAKQQKDKPIENINTNIVPDRVVKEDSLSCETDIEDGIDDVDFNTLHIAEGPTPIVNVNAKDHTVVVQLKSGKANKMSKTDSESLLLARRAIAESHYQTPAVSSPAHFSVVETHNKNNGIKEQALETEFTSKNVESKTPTLINSYQKELSRAFEELSMLSKKENSLIDDSLLSLTIFLQWSEVTRALSEISSLNTSVIEEEFRAISNSREINCNQTITPLIDFDGFCILMERLETLGERRSVILNDEDRIDAVDSRPSPTRRYSVSNFDLTSEVNISSIADKNNDEVEVPEEIVTSYEILRDENGVSADAILKWENIQEALQHDIVNTDDIKNLIELAKSEHKRQSNTDATIALDLREFYSFAVKLQLFVDEKCGAW